MFLYLFSICLHSQQTGSSGVIRKSSANNSAKGAKLRENNNYIAKLIFISRTVKSYVIFHSSVKHNKFNDSIITITINVAPYITKTSIWWWDKKKLYLHLSNVLNAHLLISYLVGKQRKQCLSCCSSVIKLEVWNKRQCVDQ